MSNCECEICSDEEASALAKLFDEEKKVLNVR